VFVDFALKEICQVRMSSSWEKCPDVILKPTQFVG